MKIYKYISALSIAGFDGSGGAGIQADIKTFSALGCYATSVLTALPVQNTTGVKNIFPVSMEAVSEQIESIMEDIPPDAIKIGMVHTPHLVETIVRVLKKYPKRPIVFDPVMVATSGHKLVEEETIRTAIEQLFPLSDLITPNMDEAAVLAQMKVNTIEDMRKAGRKIMDLGCKSVLLKGGHLKSDHITSLYFSENTEVLSYEYSKFPTKNTHGSGCTLSSAIAAYLARGFPIADAVKKGQEYTHNAIKNGKDVQTGAGNGPLNHFYKPEKLIKNEVV